MTKREELKEWFHEVDAVLDLDEYGHSWEESAMAVSHDGQGEPVEEPDWSDGWSDLRCLMPVALVAREPIRFYRCEDADAFAPRRFTTEDFDALRESFRAAVEELGATARSLWAALVPGFEEVVRHANAAQQFLVELAVYGEVTVEAHPSHLTVTERLLEHYNAANVIGVVTHRPEGNPPPPVTVSETPPARRQARCPRHGELTAGGGCRACQRGDSRRAGWRGR